MCTCLDASYDKYNIAQSLEAGRSVYTTIYKALNIKSARRTSYSVAIAADATVSLHINFIVLLNWVIYPLPQPYEPL